MDINAQNDAAIRNRYSHLIVVFDPYHNAKNYNDRVISELRKKEQKHLKGGIEKAKRVTNVKTSEFLFKTHNQHMATKHV